MERLLQQSLLLSYSNLERTRCNILKIWRVFKSNNEFTCHGDTLTFIEFIFQGGGGLVNQLKKSYSLGDLSDTKNETREDGSDDVDTLTTRRLRQRKRSPRRQSSTQSAIYFSELDIRHDVVPNIHLSQEDTYSSDLDEEFRSNLPLKLEARKTLVRSSSIGSKARVTRSTRSTNSSVPKTTQVSHIKFNLFHWLFII